MYSYTWDTETGGLLLNTSPLQFSKEPRPVYAKELDILGFNKYWSYDPNSNAPYMWAESNTYIYKGRVVARTKGGSLILVQRSSWKVNRKNQERNLSPLILSVWLKRTKKYLIPSLRKR